MKNKPKPASRPKKQPNSPLIKTPAVKATFLGKKKKPVEKTDKKKIITLDNDNLHKMETELRETKERLRLLSEAAEEGIAVHDNGLIIEANDALARIFGYELSEMIGMNAKRLATPESWKVIQKHIAAGYDQPYESVGVRKDGTTFTCSLVGKPYKYKGRTVRLSTFHDITERKQAEEKLRREEQRFRALAEQSSDIIVFVNRDGIVTYENPAMEKLLGFKPEERIGVNLFDRIHPDDLKFARDMFNKFTVNMSNTSSRDINSPVREIRIRHQDGSWRTFETSASKLLNDNIVETVIISVRDITERKQAEEILRNYLSQLNNINENLADGMVYQINSGKDGTLRDFSYLSPAVERLHGVKWVDAFHNSSLIYGQILEEDRNSLMEAETEAYINKTKLDKEVRIKTASGDIHWRQFLSVPSALPNGDLVWDGIEIDVTERKKTETQREAALEVVRERDLRFRKLSSHVPGMIYQFMRRSDGTYCVPFSSEAIKDIFGCSPQDVQNDFSPIAKVIFPDDLDKLITSFEYSAQHLTNWQLEYRVQIPGQSIKWLFGHSTPEKMADGSIIWHGFNTDITERKNAEGALQESEIKYRTLFESASDTILLMDHDTFIDCNQKTLEMFDCTREQIIGQPPYQFSPEVQPDGRNSKEKALEKINAAVKGQPQFFEWKHCRYDGTLFDAEISLNSFNNKGKYYIQSIVRDITDRKRAGEELKKYREHLEELVRERTIKLEASNKELEAFSYSASHDLRAPLRSIDGFSQALLEDCEDKLDIQGKDYLIRIRAAIRRMTELIEDLLQLSRITRTEMDIEKINLTRIARFIIDELQKSQPQRIVDTRIAEGMEESADSKLMRIVLENLLGNAWKFTEKQAKAVIEFGCTKKGEEKVYFIRDNGVGFDMAYADKLFAPFQRLHTEEEFPGTGIGLATVRRIIHRHGGKIWTEGQTGKGATFYFSLNEK